MKWIAVILSVATYSSAFGQTNLMVGPAGHVGSYNGSVGGGMRVEIARDLNSSVQSIFNVSLDLHEQVNGDYLLERENTFVQDGEGPVISVPIMTGLRFKVGGGDDNFLFAQISGGGMISTESGLMGSAGIGAMLYMAGVMVEHNRSVARYWDYEHSSPKTWTSFHIFMRIPLSM
ncbi:MAG: hypothetical protein F4Y38_01015 [Gemmatimonadetes bacterium]|nr:hypothetical protein [Gemmatimonadota bacterium]MXY47857.1 hypothetical protein [Gemmatimonadota bacterium]MYG85982.1 hypothetical protein [Gemmatimonadota bacterium]MYJ89344.1 hypothetical protein [Gemmatimonadota bacterium]